MSRSDLVDAEVRELRERLAATEQYTALTLARATRMSQVISVLGNDTDLDRVVEHAAVTMTELFSADVAVVLLGEGHELTVAAQWGLRRGDVPAGVVTIAAQDELTPARPTRTGPAADLGLPSWLDRYGARHAAWVRMFVGEDSLGMMLFVRRGDVPFAASDETELRALAQRLALAVENGQLNQRMRSKIEQLARLQQFTVDLASTLEPEAVAQLVADAAVETAAVGACAVITETEPLATSGCTTPGGDWDSLSIESAGGAIARLTVRDCPRRGSETDDRLQHLLGLAGLALEKALLYRDSQELARRDSLTGLLGHRPFHESLAALEQAGEPFALAVADIDDFKRVNDLYGHPAGDQVLREVAAVLAAQVRVEDAVYRTGGEEFCVVLPGVTADHAHVVVERLRAAVGCLSAPLPVTVSVGLASFPKDAATRVDLIARADAALYASKRSGKNRVTLAAVTSDAAEPASPWANDRIDLRLLHGADPDTAVHGAHVANLAVATARRLGIPDERVPLLRTGAALHDIGKIAIPHEILTKPGSLDAHEMEIIRTHPVVGAQLMRVAGHPDAARFVLEHHENVDGTGYPSGLRGDDIALESRVIRVVDAYLAMTFDRPYRRAMTREAAFAELRRCSGTHFEPTVVEALIAVEIGARADLLAA